MSPRTSFFARTRLLLTLSACSAFALCVGTAVPAIAAEGGGALMNMQPPAPGLDAAALVNFRKPIPPGQGTMYGCYPNSCGIVNNPATGKKQAFYCHSIPKAQFPNYQADANALTTAQNLAPLNLTIPADMSRYMIMKGAVTATDENADFCAAGCCPVGSFAFCPQNGVCTNNAPAAGDYVAYAKKVDPNTGAVTTAMQQCQADCEAVPTVNTVLSCACANDANGVATDLCTATMDVTFPPGSVTRDIGDLDPTFTFDWLTAMGPLPTITGSMRSRTGVVTPVPAQEERAAGGVALRKIIGFQNASTIKIPDGGDLIFSLKFKAMQDGGDVKVETPYDGPLDAFGDLPEITPVSAIFNGPDACATGAASLFQECRNDGSVPPNYSQIAWFTYTLPPADWNVNDVDVEFDLQNAESCLVPNTDDFSLINSLDCDGTPGHPGCCKRNGNKILCTYDGAHQPPFNPVSYRQGLVGNDSVACPPGNGVSAKVSLTEIDANGDLVKNPVVYTDAQPKARCPGCEECAGLTNALTCGAVAECVWDASIGVCQQGTYCPSYLTCCKVSPCSAVTNVAECQAAPGCKWDAALNACTGTYGKYLFAGRNKGVYMTDFDNPALPQAPKQAIYTEAERCLRLDVNPGEQVRTIGRSNIEPVDAAAVAAMNLQVKSWRDACRIGGGPPGFIKPFNVQPKPKALGNYDTGYCSQIFGFGGCKIPYEKGVDNIRVGSEVNLGAVSPPQCDIACINTQYLTMCGKATKDGMVCELMDYQKCIDADGMSIPFGAPKKDPVTKQELQDENGDPVPAINYCSNTCLGIDTVDAKGNIVKGKKICNGPPAAGAAGPAAGGAGGGGGAAAVGNCSCDCNDAAGVKRGVTNLVGLTKLNCAEQNQTICSFPDPQNPGQNLPGTNSACASAL